MDANLLAQIVALAGGLTLVLVAAREQLRSQVWRAGLMQDAVYIAARVLITLPLSVAILAGLDGIVSQMAPGLQVGWLPGQAPWVQFIVYVVLMDGLAWLLHRLFHAVPALWRLHAVHHAAPSLNPLTTTRVHLLEILPKRIVMWAPLAILGEPTVTLAWFIALDGFWGFLVHSGLRVRLGPLRYLVVEPRYHQLHHARDPAWHHANYAERLVIWDLLAGCARFPDPDAPAPATGIDDPAFPIESDPRFSAAVRTWVAQLVHPLRPSGRRTATLAPESTPPATP